MNTTEETVPRYKFDLLVDHAQRQENEITRLRRENNELRYYNTDNVWFWQEHDNHLESLTCPIVISADDLRRLLSKRDA